MATHPRIVGPKVRRKAQKPSCSIRCYMMSYAITVQHFVVRGQSMWVSECSSGEGEMENLSSMIWFRIVDFSYVMI